MRMYIKQHISGEMLRFGAHIRLRTLRSDARTSSQTVPFSEHPKVGGELT